MEHGPAPCVRQWRELLFVYFDQTLLKHLRRRAPRRGLQLQRKSETSRNLERHWGRNLRPRKRNYRTTSYLPAVVRLKARASQVWRTESELCNTNQNNGVRSIFIRHWALECEQEGRTLFKYAVARTVAGRARYRKLVDEFLLVAN